MHTREVHPTHPLHPTPPPKRSPCSHTSMVRMGVAPCTQGFSALGVLLTSSLPSPLTDSHAQPLPNWVAPGGGAGGAGQTLAQVC